MTGGPDPLGKRALFWMPVESTAPDRDPATGTHTGSPRRARPLGKHALYSDADDDRRVPPPPPGDPVPDRGLFRVTCSTCGEARRIGVLDLLVLQFPFGIWFPGRTFDHKMTCPACRRRTWLSVTVSR
ncbi:MAG TPA: hypothetical protein VHZ02_20095 [Acidimicrobiales bacterium]|nr:hypothetical protein [Acidimicrobiales bacterium]